MNPEQSSSFDLVLQQVVHRFSANPNEFVEAQARLLPADTTHSPKLVLLDTLHWIELAKVRYGGTTRRRVPEALDALRRGVQSGAIIVACTDTNIREISQRAKTVSRIECADFLVDLSGNFSVMGHVLVQEIETRNVISGLHAMEGVRQSLMSWGFGHALSPSQVSSGEPRLDEALNLLLSYPELSAFHVAHMMDRTQIRELRQHGEVQIDRARAVRELDQTLTYEERLDTELTNSYGLQLLPPLLSKLGVAPTALAGRLSTREQRRDFWMSIPTVDTFLKLVLQRDRNTHAKTQLNDVNDLGLMQVGVPYANFVATENLWANIYKQTDLPARYGCYVTSDLGDLVDALQCDGCI